MCTQCFYTNGIPSTGVYNVATVRNTNHQIKARFEFYSVKHASQSISNDYFINILQQPVPK